MTETPTEPAPQHRTEPTDLIRVPRHGPPGADPYESAPDGRADEPPTAERHGVPRKEPRGTGPRRVDPGVPKNGPPGTDPYDPGE
jgi:hypothetical protein